MRECSAKVHVLVVLTALVRECMHVVTLCAALHYSERDALAL